MEPELAREAVAAAREYYGEIAAEWKRVQMNYLLILAAALRRVDEAEDRDLPALDEVMRHLVLSSYAAELEYEDAISSYVPRAWFDD